MKKLVPCFTTAALVGLLFATVASADEVKSGLEPGSSVPAFNVKDVTGPSKGKSLCYRCRYGGRPVVSVFARTVDDNLAQLIKQVDYQVGKNEQMKAFVVLLTDDPDTAEPQLAEWAKKHKIANTPLTIFDGPSGPPDYKIAKQADVSVMMWVDGAVQVNHAFAKGKLSKASIKSVVGDTSKILQ